MPCECFDVKESSELEPSAAICEIQKSRRDAGATEWQPRHGSSARSDGVPGLSESRSEHRAQFHGLFVPEMHFRNAGVPPALFVGCRAGDFEGSGNYANFLR